MIFKKTHLLCTVFLADPFKNSTIVTLCNTNGRLVPEMKRITKDNKSLMAL